MKIAIEIDCTPTEARTFLGFPDVEDVQESVLKAVQDRLAEAVGTMDSETLLKTWLPTGIKGFEELQKAFWSGMGGPTDAKKEPS